MPQHPVAHAHTTVEVGIAWAYLAIRHTDLLHALRGTLMLMRYPGSGLVSRKQLVRDYEDVLGVKPGPAYHDIHQMARTLTVSGMDIRLVSEVGEGEGKVLHRHSLRKMAEKLTLKNLGYATIRLEALRTIDDFRSAIYEAIVYANTDHDGYWTISRAGIKKLTDISETGQRLVEERLGIEVRENVAILIDADDQREQYLPHGPRQRRIESPQPRRATQIRNSYRPVGTFVIRISRSRFVQTPASPVDDHTPAEERETLRPELGDKVPGQTYHSIPPLRGTLPATRTFDVFIDESKIRARYGPRPAGVFMRVPQGCQFGPKTKDQGPRLERLVFGPSSLVEPGTDSQLAQLVIWYHATQGASMAAKPKGGDTSMTQIHRGAGSTPKAGKVGGMPAGNFQRPGGKKGKKGK
jgi:hypothetical protein